MTQNPTMREAAPNILQDSGLSLGSRLQIHLISTSNLRDQAMRLKSTNEPSAQGEPSINPWSYRRISIYLVCLMLTLVAIESTSEAKTFPKPIVRTIEGWKIEIDPALLSEENQAEGELALKALANHLQRIIWILPPDRVESLRKLPIRIDWMHELTNMQYHPGRSWLERNGHDPNLVKHVHIPRARQLLNPSQWAKHPYVVLHELAHAYHDQILSFEHPEVIANYEQARNAGIYEKVMLYTGSKVQHYGLTNHKEYFAECTEAYLGVNDFFPFVRAELKEHDPRMHALMEKIWGRIR